MKEQLERRLGELKKEFESSQKTLAELEAKQASVRETMLRISGAIQVIEEELSKEQQGTKAARASTAARSRRMGKD